MLDINKAIENLDWNKEPKGLYEPIAYTLASGGKRLRPTLALIAADVFTLDDTPEGCPECEGNGPCPGWIPQEGSA